MTKFLFKTLIAMLLVIASHHALAQTATPTASATASDVAALREQVEALTETVKALLAGLHSLLHLFHPPGRRNFFLNGKTHKQDSAGSNYWDRLCRGGGRSGVASQSRR